jgi:hypothetical protein
MRKPRRKFVIANSRHLGFAMAASIARPPGLQPEDRGYRNLSLSRRISLGGEFQGCAASAKARVSEPAVRMAPGSAAV